jgi:hypothetical protein
MSFGVDRGSHEGLYDPLGDVLLASDAVRELDPAGMVDEELKTDLLRFARHRSREDATFATWVLAAVRRQVGVEDGYVDTAGWLSWKTGKSRADIRRIVRLAELCELLSATGAAWHAGKISTTAVEMIADARVPNCDDELIAMEAELLDRAERGDHKTLQMLTQHFKACARADGSKPEQPDGVTVADVGDRGVLKGDLTKTGLQTMREALEKFTRPPVANDESTLAQRQAEGLIRICEIALERGPEARGARPVVSYLTQVRTESDATHPMTMGLMSGVIDPRERERILCDSIIVPVSTNHLGEILDIGRATPVWNRAQRRAITARSPHCQWPGCQTIAAWCDIHHFQHWEHGGETNIANGVHLCRRHHVFLHQHRDWHCTFDHQHFRVFRPDGTEVHPDAWHDLAA